ncbi:MAG: NAD-dependent epimerase/dehydratase family protein [Chlamydiota bacterium]|nr:NAD-dependent epimerase/dehydratase family protein [Chlamydiota bacterium]
MSQNVLVTGGAGFIGSDIVRHHLELGDHVWAVDNLTTGRIENLHRYLDHAFFSFDKADIRQWDKLADAVSWSDRIYHMAAVVGQHRVLGNPVETITNNVDGCERILKEMSNSTKDVRLLIASTSSVYHRTDPGTDGKLHENSLLSFGSGEVIQETYPLSKLMNEVMALSFVLEKGLHCTVARLFNTIGVNQCSQYGMVVPNFIQSALKGEPITVFGSGEQSRAFINVHDTVRALDLLLTNPESKGVIVNVGSDLKLTINELAKVVKERCGSDSEIQHISYQEAYGMNFRDVDHRCPDTTLLNSLINFSPEWSLEETIDEVISSYSQGK